MANKYQEQTLADVEKKLAKEISVVKAISNELGIIKNRLENVDEFSTVEFDLEDIARRLSSHSKSIKKIMTKRKIYFTKLYEGKK
jgi:hypothetical protein